MPLINRSSKQNSFMTTCAARAGQPKNTSERVKYIRNRSQERIHFYAEVACEKLQEEIKGIQSRSTLGKDKDIAKRQKAIETIRQLERGHQDLLNQKLAVDQDMRKLTHLSHKISKDFKHSVDKITYGHLFKRINHGKWLDYRYHMRNQTREKKFRREANRGFDRKHHLMQIGNIQADSLIIPCNLLINTLVPQSKNQVMYPSVERKNAQGLANFQESSYRVDGNEVFSGLRSAALACDPNMLKIGSTHKMTRSERRLALIKQERESNAERAKQLLTFSFSRFLQLPENRHFLKHLTTTDATYAIYPSPFTHTTMSLLSLIGAERHMFIEELRALKSQEGTHKFELEIGGRKVTIEADVRTDVYNLASSPFVYSNRQNTKISAFYSLIYVISGIASQVFLRLLSRQQRYNQQAWNHLNARFDLFQQKMQSLEKDSRYIPQERLQFKQRLKYAQLIREQILHLEGPDAYASRRVSNPSGVQARLVILASLMGEGVHWHCKSGKDRTGILDIEAKYLLHHLFTQDILPPLDVRAESNEQRNVRRQIALEGGNNLVTLENTGESGMLGVKHSQTGHLLGKHVAHLVAGDSRLV